MRQTLRRSCGACVNSKSRCDLRTPHCSRCAKRKLLCVYANEPFSPSSGPPRDSGKGRAAWENSHEALTLHTSQFGSLDPFESYPHVRLPRKHVQRLIHSFLHKIAFQYYPLDLNPSSNPFLISWWPLAVGDPALFHVSLQTACLDEEFFGQKGFQMSELLMADSVTLLRRKVENASLAVQDGTMNSVITLATIEFGKGNTTLAAMHVEGVKRLVDLRGGIQSVMQTTPLTARMVSWVSMIIMGNPQFDTQSDDGMGDGLSPIPEWQLDPNSDGNNDANLPPIDIELNTTVRNVLERLRRVFQRAKSIPLPPTRVHDLTCFILHRLLSVNAKTPSMIASDCIRYAIILYMLIIQGPTYFTHVSILNSVVSCLVAQLEQLDTLPRVRGQLDIWLASIGLTASHDTAHYDFFKDRILLLSDSLRLASWHDASLLIKNVLWLESPQIEHTFQRHWDAVLGNESQSMTLTSTIYSPSTPGMPGFI